MRGALDSLPALPLGAGSKPSEAVLTGTDASPLAPTLAPNWCKRTTPLSKADKMTTDGQAGTSRGDDDVTSDVDNKKEPLTITVSDSLRAGDRIRTGDVQLGKLTLMPGLAVSKPNI